MSDGQIDRKHFLKEGYLIFLRSLSSATEEAKPAKRQIRPPGAVEESKFLSLCNLCGKCWEGCSYGAIKQDGKESSAPGFPVITPNERPCYLCDVPVCSRVCDEGAILPVEKENVRLGIAVVKRSACLAYSQTILGCNYCHDKCPLKDKAIVYENGPVIKEEHCTGCGICEFFCVSNPKAIEVFPV